MNVVTVLDSFRKGIAGDPLALAVLAYVYRAGEVSEGQLADSLGRDKRNIAEKIDELYRSRFVHCASGDTWTTTELADEVLSRLGIAGVVADSMIADENIEQAHKFFLRATLQVQMAERPEQSRIQAAILRLVRWLRGVEAEESRDERTRLLYGCIVGLDAAAQQLAGHAYPRAVRSWHEAHQTDLWKSAGHSLRLDKVDFDGWCQTAAEDVQASTILLVIDSSYFKAKREADSVPRTLSWLRVGGAMRSRVADGSLSAAASVTPGVLENMENFCSYKFPGRPSYVSACFGAVHDWKPALRKTMSSILLRTSGTLPWEVASGLQPSAKVSARLEWLRSEESFLSELRGWKLQLERGGVDQLSEVDIEAALGLLDEVQSILRRRVAVDANE